MIPEIETDQREIEPSKMFENYYSSGIGGITTIPAILSTIMSFLIEENLNGGWGGLLSVGINSWYRNLTYDSLNGTRDLELISIQQIIETFSDFIDKYVDSFVITPTSPISTIAALDDWVEDLSDNEYIDNFDGPILNSNNAAHNDMLNIISNLNPSSFVFTKHEGNDDNDDMDFETKKL